MATISRPGRYIGGITSHKVHRGDNGCLQFWGRCEFTQFKPQDVGKFDELEQPEQATAFINLTRKDGSKIDAQVDAIMRATGWDGRSLRDLNEMDLSEKVFSFVAEEDNYKDERRVSIAWINSAEGFKPPSDDELTAWDSEWQDASDPPYGGHAPANAEDIPF